MAGLTPTLTNDTSQLIASQAGGVSGTALAETGALEAVSAIPIVGQAASAILGPILGLINAHHRAAVAHEAALLNAAVPEFFKTLQNILQAYNAGLDAASADAYIDQAVSDYYSNVSQGGAGSIEGHWPYNCPTDTSVKPGTCNGPCEVGHWEIETAACEAKGAIASAEAGVPATAQFCTNNGCPSHAGYQGFAPWGMTVQKLTGVGSLLAGSGLGKSWTDLSATGKLIAVALLALLVFSFGMRRGA